MPKNEKPKSTIAKIRESKAKAAKEAAKTAKDEKPVDKPK